MDLRFTDAERAFRAEVRGFIDTHLPAATRARMVEGRVPTKAQSTEWHRMLHERGGWSVADWPAEHGGPGWNAVQRYIFREELQQAPAPQPSPFGTLMVGPVLIAFGTPEQQARFLPGIRSGEEWWCQGFSEPGAGSDLASLKTRALRDGDDYVIDGQKTWTTYAQYADWIFLLVRTDPAARKPQEGISFVLANMRSSGITVRPIITIDGAHEVNEVFLDAVRIPATNLVGQENRGWDCAKFLLGNERTGQARVGMSKERLRSLKRIAREAPGPDGRPLLEDQRFRERIAAVEVELKALEVTTLRVLAADAARGAKRAPDPASSILKVKGSEIQQAISELFLDAAGPYALPAAVPDAEGWNEPEIAPAWAAMAAPTYLNWRKLSIYGGSNEIQRNIMAKVFLGL